MWIKKDRNMKRYGTPPLQHVQEAMKNLELERDNVLIPKRIKKSHLARFKIMWDAVNNPNKEFRLTDRITGRKERPSIVEEIKTEIAKYGLPNMMVYQKLNKHWYIKFKQ